MNILYWLENTFSENGGWKTCNAACFQARNRHNLEQSTKLAQNKELLNKRNAQVTVMDQRIGDLRERLHKKKAEVRNFTLIIDFIFL